MTDTIVPAPDGWLTTKRKQLVEMQKAAPDGWLTTKRKQLVAMQKAAQSPAMAPNAPEISPVSPIKPTTVPETPMEVKSDNSKISPTTMILIAAGLFVLYNATKK